MAIGVQVTAAVEAAAPGEGEGDGPALPRWARPAVAAGAGVAVVVFCLALAVLHGVNGRQADLTDWWFGNLAIGLGLGLPGIVVARRAPANPIGWLLLAAGVGAALTGFGREYLALSVTHPGLAPGAVPVAVVTMPFFTLSMATLPAALLLFPDGTVLSPRWRLAVWVLAVAWLAGAAAQVLYPEPVTVAGTSIDNPLGVPSPRPAIELVAGLSQLALAGVTVAGIVCLVLRFRRADEVQRLQITWVVLSFALLGVEVVTELVGANPAAQVTAPLAIGAFAVSLAIAILRWHLFDIDLIVSRTLSFVLLSAVVGGAYLAVILVLDAALHESVRPGPGLLAAVAAALVFAALHHRVQRAVDRLVYGDRRDPYRALARLGDRVGTPSAEGLRLDDLADVVAQALKVPYVGVELGEGGSAEVGALVGRPTVVPLEVSGAEVGRLVVGPRTPGGSLGRSDRRLLRELARHVAVVAHAVQLTGDLRSSRTRLVNAREDERRRLRRDLHDGLGPALAAMTLRIDAASALLDDDPDEARASLAELKQEVRTTLEDIRRLVYGLRPPALDELGLVSALREHLAGLEPGDRSRPWLQVTVDTSGELDDLPAAVEVAAYRIVLEAVTNAARHGAARSCRVRLSRNGALSVVVDDDGCGLPDGWRPGVGVRSLRERTAELGGRCALGSGPLGGVRVEATLPVAVGP